MRRNLITLLFVVMLATLAHSQQKYAVLITGCKPSVGLGDNSNPNIIGSTIANHQYDEFWNDTYLMWELLTQKFGYANENVFVLYYNGNDWTDGNSANTNIRYKSLPSYGLQKITDFPADTNNIVQVLTNLKNELTQNDFLFVWTFGHGNYNTLTNKGLLVTYDPLNPSSTSTYMTDTRFGQLINQIPAAKKVVWLAQCFGGDFVDNISTSNGYFLSGGLPGQPTSPAEDICPANYKNERYYVGSTLVDTCNHGEFNFHVYSSTNGFAPSYSAYHAAPSCPNIYFPFQSQIQIWMEL
jgi:hypothetical protein